MFYLSFGLIWTAITLFILFAVCSAGAADTAVLVFLGAFLLIGICIMVIGLKKILKDVATKRYGQEGIGIVINIKPSGASVNGRPIMNMEVAVLEQSGLIQTYTESMGNKDHYTYGDFVRVLYYEGDINVIEQVHPKLVPQDIMERFIYERYVTPEVAGRYGGQFNSQYGEQYGGQFNNQYTDQYSAQYDNHLGGRSVTYNGENSVIVDGVEYVRKE